MQIYDDLSRKKLQKQPNILRYSNSILLFTARPRPRPNPSLQQLVIKMSAAWPSGTARRLQILRDGFDSWLDPTSCGKYTG